MINLVGNNTACIYDEENAEPEKQDTTFGATLSCILRNPKYPANIYLPIKISIY